MSDPIKERLETVHNVLLTKRQTMFIASFLESHKESFGPAIQRRIDTIIDELEAQTHIDELTTQLKTQTNKED